MQIIPNNNPNLKVLLLWYSEEGDEVIVEERVILAWHVEKGYGESIDIEPITNYQPLPDEWECLLDRSDGRVEYGDTVYNTRAEAIESCLLHAQRKLERAKVKLA